MNKVYLASPFFNDTEAANVKKVAGKLRELGYEVFVPMEHEVQRNDQMTDKDWACKVFEMDVNAIDDSDIIVVLYYGMISDSGTSWEQGYAFGQGKYIIEVDMPGAENLVNLMNHNCSNCSVTPEELFAVKESLTELEGYSVELKQS